MEAVVVVTSMHLTSWVFFRHHIYIGSCPQSLATTGTRSQHEAVQDIADS